MKPGFYPKLALEGIRKNKRIYVPYILTCIGMVMMTYIIMYLQYAESVANISGGDTLQVILKFGGFVVAVFAAIFLFYTNSFLMRRRKKEFGLYNILGMGKKNIGILLAFETFMIAVFSIVCGLLGGILLSKLSELGLINVIRADVTYSLYLPYQGILITAGIFSVIFILIFINSLIQLQHSSALSLLRSEAVGEKPPKANWFLGILGVLILCGAYFISVSIKDPFTALGIFFVAVIMVIIATYLIMISGSVLLCRILQKNKKIYYKPNNFVSVSSMVYRMKRNGAGLASICILATMVLVMISSTSALFFGSEDSINSRYPRSFGIRFGYENRFATDNDQELFRNRIGEELEKFGAKEENVLEFRCAEIAGMLYDDKVIYNPENINGYTYDISKIVQFYFVDVKDYNRIMGRHVDLDDDEALIYAYREDYTYDTLNFLNVRQYKIKEHLTEFFENGEMTAYITPSAIVVVSDIESASKNFLNSNGDDMIQRDWNYWFDVSVDRDTQIAIAKELRTMIKDVSDEAYHNSIEAGLDVNVGMHYGMDGKEDYRMDYYSGLGGLFYLGIILSIVFIFAAVMIIYYKQVSEGYEDCSRFEIMQKVGMTKKNIRKSINSQLLTVFFLPLLFAGLHLAFAFPIIDKLLLLFGLTNRMLFAFTTVASFLVFALFYVVVYRITSNVYYHIVSTSDETK